MSDTTRTEEPRLTLIMYRGLIPFGLVAAATIIMFGVASFSFLYASGGTSRAGICDRGVEVEPELSGGFPGIHANRPPVSAETELPGSAAKATASTFPDSPAAHDMRLPEVTGAQLSPEPLAPSASEGNATQQASLNGITQTRVPEVSGAQSVFATLSASASEGSAKQDAPLNGAAQTRAPEVSRAQPVSEPLSRSVSEESATQDAPLNETAQTRVPEISRAQSVFELSASAGEGSTTQHAPLNGAAQTRAPEVSGAQPVSEPLSRSVSEESATQDAPLNETAQTRVPEISGAQSVFELSASAGEGSATQHAPLSGIVQTFPIPAAQRDRVFREFAMHHDQRRKFGTNPGAALSRPTPATRQRATSSLGGAGQIWVNTASKIYHCPGTRWYGKTNQGGFMSETQALAQGARSDHGKACTGLVRITG